jgi:hypothetical protein
MEQPVDVRTPSQGCVAQGALDGQALGVIIPCSKVTEKSGKSGEILWYTYKKLWKITILNGKIHYFYGHFQ